MNGDDQKGKSGRIESQLLFKNEVRRREEPSRTVMAGKRPGGLKAALPAWLTMSACAFTLDNGVLFIGMFYKVSFQIKEKKVSLILRTFL